MLSELVRILRPGGYLLLREHDVKKERTLRVKYLNFIHAFMMIARVGEFSDNPENNVTDWEQQKANIINYTNSIQYRTRDEWKQVLENVGFRLKATLDYDISKYSNPQALYYAIYQLNPN
jgi:ubiquinone/menaquinone biosynthesis C-methylase UbiE